MSELRDLAAALTAISKSLTSIENHVANQDANCAQMRTSLHQLRSQLQGQELERSERERALAQLQEFMGGVTHKQLELHDMLTNLQATVADGFRFDRQRLRQLEKDDEATQP